MPVEIRKATAADTESLIALGRRLHAESPRYGRWPFDDDKARLTTAHMLATGVVLVAEDCGSLVGMMAGAVVEHFFSRARYGAEITVYVIPEHRGSRTGLRLIKAFEEWALEQGAQEICLGISTGIHTDRTASFYRRMGYETYGVSTIKEFDRGS